MLKGSCHCGAVRLTLPSTPLVATSCNCSLCRRIGGPWVYFEFGTVQIEGHPENTAAYIWGDKTLRTLHCRTCGCVTHWEPLEVTPGVKHGVHLGNFSPGLIASVTVRRFDGADSWTYLDPMPVDTAVPCIGSGGQVQILNASDHALLDEVAPDVFDDVIDPRLVREFLSDPRHHLAVARDADGRIVGMASGVHYVHPDKPAQMFINEVGVSPAFEGRGIGKQLLAALLQHAKALGCTEAWTATEPDNDRAQALYARAGGEKDPTPFVMFTFALRERARGAGPISGA